VGGRRRLNGFTLIEMLIAMTLLGIMVVLLFASLRIAAESWNAGEDRIIKVNKKAVVYQFFKQRFRSIRPVSIQPAEAGAMPQSAFQGQSQSIRFVAALPVAAARKGLQVFQITQDSNEPTRLMVSLWPYQQTPTAQPVPETVVLLEHVKAYMFSYFGKKDVNSTADWQDDWSGAEHLPQLIKVRIALDDDSFWPEMVFPVKIAAQGAVDAGQSSSP